VGVACLGASTLASLTIPWMVKRTIDALQADAAAAPVGFYAALIIVLALVHGSSRLGSRFAITGASQKIEADIRGDLYEALQTFPPRFYAAHSTGDLMARSTSDITAVRSLVGFGAISIVSTSFAFVGVLAAMLAVDPWLTLWALAPYPALLLLARRFNLKVNERTEAAQDQLSVLSARVQEYLSGMAVVRAYTLEPRARADFGRANTEYLRLSLALARTEAGFSPLMGLIAGVGTLVVIWAGGRAVVDGRLSLGALVAFNGYLAYLTWPTMALGWTLSIVRRGLTSMTRLEEIIGAARADTGFVVAGSVRPAWTEGGLTQARPGSDTPVPAVSNAPGPSVSDTPVPAPGLRFSHLTFAYEGRAPALHDVSFEVAPGETVALVGPTGSGKSTLGLLLARLWEPPPGTVFIDGRDIREIPLATLRAGLGFVPQEGFLFSRSIAENIALGRDETLSVRLRQAADVAGIADEIERFPAGFDSVVGERGLTLSGGQRQRVTLARALAGAPPLLVLDDAFASVDAAKEEEVAANLRRAVAGRTVLMMTHRLRAACTADRIIVLDGGRVVETGRHGALVRRGGLYARLWRIQQLEEEIARA
jgi:ATP-binding cassette subfamily B multidrug efflux pump